MNHFVSLVCPPFLSLSPPSLSVYVSVPGTVISVLEKLLSQSTEQDNPSRLVIEAAHGSANKVRELVQKYPDKVSAALLLFAAVHCPFQEFFPPGHQDWGWGIQGPEWLTEPDKARDTLYTGICQSVQWSWTLWYCTIQHTTHCSSISPHCKTLCHYDTAQQQNFHSTSPHKLWNWFS